MFRRPQAEKDKFRELERKREYRADIKSKLFTSLGRSFVAGSSSSEEGSLPKLAQMTAAGRLVCKLCSHESLDIVGFQSHVRLDTHRRAVNELREEIEVQKTVIEHIQKLIKAQSDEDPEPEHSHMNNNSKMIQEDTAPGNPDSFLNKRGPLTSMKIEERIVEDPDPSETHFSGNPSPNQNKPSTSNPQPQNGLKHQESADTDTWRPETNKSLIALLAEPVHEEEGQNTRFGGSTANEGANKGGVSAVQAKLVGESEKTKDRLAQLKERAMKNRVGGGK